MPETSAPARPRVRRDATAAGPAAPSTASSTAETPAPWERRKGESSRAFTLFRAYRDFGPGRSFTKVRETLEGDERVSRTYLSRLSAEWGWVERSAAYDDEIDRRGIAARVAATVATARPFDPADLRASAGMQGLVLRLVDLVNAKLDRLGPESVPLPVALRMLEIVGTVAPGLLSPDATAAALDGLDADGLEALRQIAQTVAALPETPGPEPSPETPDAGTSRA